MCRQYEALFLLAHLQNLIRKGTNMLKIFIALVVTVIIASPSFVMAKENCLGECASCHKLEEKEATELLKKTGITVKSVKQSPVKGFFEMLVEKDNQRTLFFLDYAKKHIVQGVVVALETLQPVASHPLEQLQAKQVTSLDPAAIPVESSIVMGNPKGQKKLYVFTDPDCPYCRTMHAELKKLAKIAQDVAIHVMLFPLPMHPGAYDKARVVIETKSLDLLDKAFEGKDVPNPAKDSSKASVETIIKFANGNGISGTPTLVLTDGKIVVGMRDAETLKRMLEGK